MHIDALSQSTGKPIVRNLRWGYRWDIWKGNIGNTWFWHDDVLLNDFEGRTNSFRQRRCVVQADSFFGKQRDEDGIGRLHSFSRRDQEPLYFAAVYSELEGLALILHDDSDDPWCNAFGPGMPIFIAPERVGLFLHEETSGEDAFKLMNRFRPAAFRVDRVDIRRAA